MDEQFQWNVLSDSAGIEKQTFPIFFKSFFFSWHSEIWMAYCRCRLRRKKFFLKLIKLCIQFKNPDLIVPTFLFIRVSNWLTQRGAILLPIYLHPINQASVADIFAQHTIASYTFNETLAFSVSSLVFFNKSSLPFVQLSVYTERFALSFLSLFLF